MARGESPNGYLPLAKHEAVGLVSWQCVTILETSTTRQDCTTRLNLNPAQKKIIRSYVEGSPLVAQVLHIQA